MFLHSNSKALVFKDIPEFQYIREFERTLPQHNLTQALEADTRYLRIFRRDIENRDFNSFLHEALFYSQLASMVNRSFVFEDYNWSRPYLPSATDMELQPARIPINAFISGPTAGGEMSHPRSISADFYDLVCLESERRVLTSSAEQPIHESLEWWTQRLKNVGDRCLEVDSKPRASYFSYLSHHPVYTEFEWSTLVESTVEANLARFYRNPRVSGYNTILPTVAVVELLRGDFERGCEHDILHRIEFMETMPFLWNHRRPPSDEDIPQFYRDHCMPDVEYIVKRLARVRKANHMDRVYALTNRAGSWVETLKYELLKDGWSDVKSSLDLQLNSSQRYISMAVDMAIAQKAEVFIGNASMLTLPVIAVLACEKWGNAVEVV
ncbi:hypothetical protein H0H92_011447 [Tricholoma furcatifolium]|nr:hypothetical protein H0H92_011447 [Tricholoma furcatifolium]